MDDQQISRFERMISPAIAASLVGLGVALVVIGYSYNYAVKHDPQIINFQYYLTEKPYRPLQFAVSLLPIAVGYFFGRSRERLLALRNLYYEAVIEKAHQSNYPKLSLDAFEAASLQRLTLREREVLGLVCRGLANKEIAGLLFISEKTVKNHINSIFKKLEVSNRTNAALLVLREGSASKNRL
ncbi:MAG: response regulator transcription factor [Actinomycetota bacterium]|nr:response regulator transcription factor [Actinomycetota bacterium]